MTILVVMPLAGPAPDASPVLAANLAELAALALRRLATETRAYAALEASRLDGERVTEHLRAHRLLTEARREAVGALERLRDALPGADLSPGVAMATVGIGEPARRAAAQIVGLGGMWTIAADDLDRWAAGWDAWALAADPAGGSATAEQHRVCS